MDLKAQYQKIGDIASRHESRSLTIFAGVCRALRAMILWGLILASLPASAQTRFDVFVGLDGYVPTHGWFPVSCEVQNDGPTFLGLFEVTTDDFNGGEVRRLRVELPTGTLKRFSIPFHTSSTYSWRFHARLLDERGNVQAEAIGINVRKQIARDVPISAAVGSWIPTLPDSPGRRSRQELDPPVARLLPPLFPDNPISLETLRNIYLSSDRALELKDPQISALLNWMRAGGHLVVGVKQVGHFGGATWLESLLPIQIASLELSTNHAGLTAWVRGDEGVDGQPVDLRSWAVNQANAGRSRRMTNFPVYPKVKSPFADLPVDDRFAAAAMELAGGTIRDGLVVAGTAERPLVVTAPRGRGRLTVLLFNPAQKPFTDWELGSHFWAKIFGIPPALLVEQNINLNRYQSMDGALASMVDSHQVRKLPVGWLLLLLVGYLVVIGPLDRYWLKKINRQMLTWLTFPAYVAFFSLLIYFIGYKLRAGETEWNELHIVDVLPKGQQADWHGWTYGSIYSPENATYELKGAEAYSALRSEFGGGNSGRHWMEYSGNNFAANVSVPVWTSQLFVSDWWKNGLIPVSLTVRAGVNGWQVEARSQTDRPIEHLFLVLNDRMHVLGGLAPGTTSTMEINPGEGEPLDQFVSTYAAGFHEAINRRRNPLAGNAWEVIRDIPRAAAAAAFFEKSPQQELLAPFGQDLTYAHRPNQAFLLAWLPDYSPLSAPLNQFNPRRHHEATLFRMAIPVARLP